MNRLNPDATQPSLGSAARSRDPNSIKLSLTREIRICLQPGMGIERTDNSWSSWSADHSLAMFLLLRLTVEGLSNPDGYASIDQRSPTGFLCDVRILDDVLWAASKTTFQASGFTHSIPALLSRVALEIQGHLAKELSPVSLELAVSPHLSYELNFKNQAMVTLTQQFEFSAAHRLNSAELSEIENRDTFGKCNNPNGHGHNYVLEVSVECSADSESAFVSIAELDRIVDEHVLRHYDHKHLDLDCEDFVNVPTTVENLAQVIANRLAGKFGANRLSHIRLYETPKTWADVTLG